MPRQIVISEQHRIAAVFSEDQIQELIVAKGNLQIGDIYLGVVENVLPGIDAAFVNIGDPERNGFIHVSDLGPLRLRRAAGAITELLAPQQKVLVQVMKEPTGNKGPRLTGNISLPGRYLVLMPSGRGVNLSRRIRSENERSRLRALAILIKPAGMGIVVRTEAEGIEEEAIIEDLEALFKQWDTIQKRVDGSRPPALLNRDDDFIQRVLRDVYSADVNRIVTDTHHGLKRVKQHITTWSGGKTPQGVLVDHHRDRIAILEYFRVNAAIREALRPRVDLPSGGYIIIEPTEALTVIDVNSGSFTRSATARETVLWTNFEAATEIARQLRLRNVAGVIIVDFIDMDFQQDKFQVLEHFTKALKADKAKPQIAQLSELGLVELTRKRQGQNIYELFGQTCPTCGGLGHLVHLPDDGKTQAVDGGDRPILTREPPFVTPLPFLPSPLVPSPLVPSPIDELPVARTGASDSLISWDGPSKTSVADVFPSEAQGNEGISLLAPTERGGGNGSRRRRRREPPLRGGNGRTEAPLLPAPLTQSEDEVGIDSPVPSKSSERPLNRQGRRDGDTEVAQPELVTVEMTAEEQEVYALLGISPLVLAHQTVKNPKTAIISVVLPGQVPVDDSFPDFRLSQDGDDTHDEENTWERVELLTETVQERPAQDSLAVQALAVQAPVLVQSPPLLAVPVEIAPTVDPEAATKMDLEDPTEVPPLTPQGEDGRRRRRRSSAL